MRILANENFPQDAVMALRDRGYDVAWIRTDAPGSTDREVLQRAREENRTVVTFDKDFGELAFRHGLFPSGRVILFRIRLVSPMHVVNLAVAALESRTDWAGHFAVVEENRIRMIPLPTTIGNGPHGSARPTNG